MAQLPAGIEVNPPGLMKGLLESALWGLEIFLTRLELDLPADYRLAFRELGLAIGLHAAFKIAESMDQTPDLLSAHQAVIPQVRRLTQFARVWDSIEQFWLYPRHQMSHNWIEHRHINQVMLATSLAPDGYLACR
jgi:hypothetical protein